MKKKNFISASIIIVILAVLITILLFFTEGEIEMNNIAMNKPNDLTKNQLESFKNKRILFGHQSVGANIVKGLKEISDTFKIVEFEKKALFEEPVFMHFRVKKNGDPYSKIDHFVETVIENNNTEIALLKLCYADINKNTDINKLFKYYKKEMDELKKKHQNIKIIHSTVPLFKNSGGIKAKIKHFLKLDKNIKRNKFNELMRGEYSKEILFDLALFESTYSDGRREKAGNGNYSLANEYTDDGGHLNKKGREIIAANLINFISKL